MKTMKNIFLLLAAFLCLVACEKDGDKIYLNSIESGDLIASASEVILTQAASKDIALSLAWTRDKLVVSNPAMGAPDLLSMTLQVSTSSDFSAHVSASVESSLSKAYTGADLNAVAKNLGAIPDVANILYFRLQAKTGNNMEPVYSNVVSVSVTPYTIDMSLGFILDAKQEDTGAMLYSKASDGDYVGFMGATGWYNYFLKEGDGTIWGNDGVTQTPFLISSESTKWNFWFPGMGGCYYVDVNTNKKVWSALYIPTLTVTGDLTGEMTFDRPNVKWVMTFRAAKAGVMKVKVGAMGKLYDYSTGTDDAAAKETSIAFAQNGDNLIFGTQSGEITVNVPAAGDCTLVIDLKNPKRWTVGVVSGSDVPSEIRKEIFLSGIDDLLTGGWNFNNKLRLYDEDTEAYAGCAFAASEWGYNVFLEADNWEDKYTFAGGDAYAGTMAFKGGSDNLPAPAQGLYFFDVSLKALTYQLSAIGSEIYYSGVNGDWTLHPMKPTDVKGEFTASITIAQASKDGFQVVLDSNWTHKFGGTAGTLYYKGSNITDDATLATGTYTFTVNMIKGIYTIQ